MRPRRVLLVALIALAGCSAVQSTGPVGEPTPEGTVTPAPVPADEAGRLAPGLTDDGIENASELRRSHEAHLENRSYSHFARAAVRYENGTTHAAYGARVTVDADEGDRLVVRLPRASRTRSVERVETWSNGSTMAVRQLYENGSVEYEVTDVPRSLHLYRSSTVHLLDRFEPTPNGERTANGTVEYRLAADGVTDVPFTNYENVTRTGPGRLRAVVTSDGFVREVRLVAPVRIHDEPGRFVVEDRYDLDVERVDRPRWVPRALNESRERADTPTPR